MKHLKTYTLFERVSTKLFESSSEEVKNYLKDIFLDVEDKGIEVDIRSNSTFWKGRENLTGYRITIGDIFTRRMNNSIKTFLLKDVYNNIQIAKSYMGDEDFYLSEMRGGSPHQTKLVDEYGTSYRQHPLGSPIGSSIETYGLLYGFDLYEKGKSKLFDKPLTYLEINFERVIQITELFTSFS
jgi:hypothetical protein